jgi:hypothetical protein
LQHVARKNRLLDVGRTDLDTNGLRTGARKFNGEDAFETAQIENPAAGQVRESEVSQDTGEICDAPIVIRLAGINTVSEINRMRRPRAATRDDAVARRENRLARPRKIMWCGVVAHGRETHSV